jgi:hypothetical protein
LRASFEALRDQRLAKIQARAPDQDVAVLGTNGLFRVSPSVDASDPLWQGMSRSAMTSMKLLREMIRKVD